MNFWVTIFRHKRYLLSWNIFVAIIVMYAWSTSEKTWTSTIKFVLPQASSQLEASLGNLGSLKDNGTTFSTQLNPIKTQETILRSDVLVAKALRLDPESTSFTDTEQYKNIYEINAVELSNVFSLEVSATDPDISLKRAQILTKVYQQRLHELRKTDVSSRKEFYQSDLERARQEVSRGQYAIAQFKKSSGLVSDEVQVDKAITLLSSLKEAQAKALAEARAESDQAKSLSARLGITSKQAVRALQLDKNEDYLLVRQKLTELESTLKEQRAKLTENHPAVQETLNTRLGLQRQLKQYINQAKTNKQSGLLSSGIEGQTTFIEQLVLSESRVQAKLKEAQQYQTEINSLNSQLNTLPANQAQLQDLQRKYDIAQGVYNGLIAQMEKSNIDAFQTYPNVQLLSPPALNPIPSSKLLLIAVNAFFAAGLGSLALLLLLESRNPLLRPKDLANIEFPLMVRIPHMKRQLDDVDVTTVLGSDGEPAFLQLAAGIQSQLPETQSIDSRCLMVTSAVAGEGKTTVTTHLAWALEELGLKVLIIKNGIKNLPKKKLLSLEHASNHPEEDNDIDEENLFNSELKLPIPKPKRVIYTQFINRNSFEDRLHKIIDSNDYDFVLVDGPPITKGSVATLMASIISNVLLVVKPGKSERFPVQDALDILLQSQVRLAGLAVNDTESSNFSPRNSWKARNNSADVVDPSPAVPI